MAQQELAPTQVLKIRTVLLRRVTEVEHLRRYLTQMQRDNYAHTFEECRVELGQLAAAIGDLAACVQDLDTDAEGHTR